MGTSTLYTCCTTSRSGSRAEGIVAYASVEAIQEASSSFTSRSVSLNSCSFSELASSESYQDSVDGESREPVLL